MIADFTVKNFFSIKSEQKLSFEATSDSFMKEEYCYEVKNDVCLLKIGFIYGANASGKTNILMALEFFKELMTNVPKDKTEKIDIVPFLLDNDSRNERTNFSMSFYLDKERYVLSIELDKYRIYSEVLQVYPSTQPALLYKRNYNSETDSTSITFGTKVGLTKKSQQIIEGNTVNNCSVIAAFGKSNVETSRLNIVYEFFSKHMADVLHPTSSLGNYTKKHLIEDKDGHLKHFLVKLLKASDFNIEDIELAEKETIIIPEMEKIIQSSPLPEKDKEEILKSGKITNSELLFKHKTDNGVFNLSEDFESRGTIRLLGMAVLLEELLLKQRFIPIDEVETSIHYELLSYFIKVFLANSEGTSQLLLTTHDINLLNEDCIRRDAIWFTDKDSCGETQLIRMSSLGLHKNLSPYNAYKQGKLVKLPFLGSPYININE